MVRTRSIWLACITLGLLLARLAAGRANAGTIDSGRATPPGPGHVRMWQDGTPQRIGLAAGQFRGRS